MTYQVSRRAVGSIPEEGSSSNTIFESPSSAIASYSFLFWPPDTLPASSSFLAVRLNLLRESSTIALMFDKPLKRQKN